MEQETKIKVYTTKEMAEILKVTTRTILTYCETGRIKGVKIGHQWRVSEENLRAFINGEQQ